MWCASARVVSANPHVCTLRSQLHVVPPRAAAAAAAAAIGVQGIGVLHERGDHRSGLLRVRVALAHERARAICALARGVGAVAPRSLPPRRASRARGMALEVSTGPEPHVVARARARAHAYTHTHTHTHTHAACSERTSLPPRAQWTWLSPSRHHASNTRSSSATSPRSTRRAARAISHSSSSLAASTRISMLGGSAPSEAAADASAAASAAAGSTSSAAALAGADCARTRERCSGGVGMRLRGCVSGRQPDDASKGSLARTYVCACACAL